MEKKGVQFSKLLDCKMVSECFTAMQDVLRKQRRNVSDFQRKWILMKVPSCPSSPSKTQASTQMECEVHLLSSVLLVTLWADFTTDTRVGQSLWSELLQCELVYLLLILVWALHWNWTSSMPVLWIFYDQDCGMMHWSTPRKVEWGKKNLVIDCLRL